MVYLDTFNRRGIRLGIQANGKLRLEPGWLVVDDLLTLARKHRDQLVAEIRASSSESNPELEIVPDYHILMVATNLDSWEANDPRFGYEVMLDVCYRQLDATYYAWLRQHMESARKSSVAGNTDDDTFNALRERFNMIHEWAIRHIGEDALKLAIRTTNIKTYIPPSEQTFAAYRKTWDDAWEAYQRRVAAQSHSAPSDQAGKLELMLAPRGYAIIKSGIINDVIIFVRDETIVVPDRWAKKVRYTMDELSLIVGSAPKAVKQLHDVKRIFGGTVVPIEESDSRIFPDAKPVATNKKAQQLALLGSA